MSRLPELRAAARLETLRIDDARIAAGTARHSPEDGDPAWRPFRFGEPWGRPDATYVVDVPVHVPAAWTEGQVFLDVSLSDYMHASGPEGLAYLNGVPLHGIDRFHSAVLLSGRIEPGHEGRILIEAYSSLKDTPNVLRALDLELIDPDIDALYHDFRVLTAAVDVMPADSLPRARIMRAIERAYRVLDLRDMRSDAFRRSAGEARGLLRDAWEGVPDAWQAHTVAVGHAHIDLAWLWPVAQTRRKGARTFSTVLRLMERYPGYRFVQSQPALYEMVREDEPDLYAEVKARVGEGRWEPSGASWVEMDCNLPGGESLVRQFLLGKRFFRDELGVDPRVLWLPDVFGYSAALPQVLKGCEVDYFMTTKISWNEYNRLPYDTFLWRGIDGSEVLSYMPTTPENPHQEESARVSTIYTYNAQLTPYDVQGAWREYRQKAINDELLYLFGYGDGGGGPTADMLETATRLETLPGITLLLQGSAEEFFAGLDRRVRHDPDLPTWVGELYFEYHRGTYTSQAWIKRANRKAELLYREAELWASGGHARHRGEDRGARRSGRWLEAPAL